MTDANIEIGLQDSVTELLGEVSKQLVMRPNDLEGIKRVTTNLRRWLYVCDGFDKLVRSTIRNLISQACAQCKHVGATSGYNERDGSWMNPCPTCGATR